VSHAEEVHRGRGSDGVVCPGRDSGQTVECHIYSACYHSVEHEKS
jgi:hypothetical protein